MDDDFSGSVDDDFVFLRPWDDDDDFFQYGLMGAWAYRAHGGLVCFVFLFTVCQVFEQVEYSSIEVLLKCFSTCDGVAREGRLHQLHSSK